MKSDIISTTCVVHLISSTTCVVGLLISTTCVVDCPRTLIFLLLLFINHDSKKVCLIDSSYLIIVNFYVNVTIYFALSEYHIICL